MPVRTWCFIWPGIALDARLVVFLIAFLQFLLSRNAEKRAQKIDKGKEIDARNHSP
jgi:hypothetical protein